MGVVPGVGQLPALWLWVAGVVFICMTTTIIMVILTAGEVSRSAAKLLDGMKSVERGDHNVHLRITSTDEYADLFRGFNLMTEGLREEAKILGLSQDLMGELQLDPLLERIMRATTELLDAERSTLFIYDRKTKELWSRFAEGLGKKEIRIPRDQGIAGSVFTSGKTENIADPYADSRFNQSVDRATGFRTRCMLAMPVLNKAGQPIGVVEVLNKRGGQFSLQDENRLRAFSAQAAICLENARLFDEVIQIRDYNESILRSTSNGMLALDAKGVITSANPAAVEMFGGGTVDLGMLLGQTAQDTFRDKNAWVMASIAKVASSGETDLSPDADLHRPNGEVASVNMTAVPLRETDGTVVGTLLIFEDLSSEKRMRTTMSRYMSKEVADELLSSGGNALEGREQEISILFADILGFTSISEAIGPRETVSMLNEYFEEMVEVIFAHGGILDKYIGDAIMALFGAPFVQRGDADRALRAACGMTVALKAYNVKRTQSGKPPVNIGVGLNSGPAILGSIGSPKRMEYTAIGDSVNIASRLEAATRLYNVHILVAEPTIRTLIENHPVREIDLMSPKGKSQPVAVFEALGHLPPEKLNELTQPLAAFREGLGRYRARQFREANEAFQESLQAWAGDGPSKLYVERCKHYLAHPPPDDWDCVWRLKEK
jgi:adenylate cyclase